MSDIVNFLKFHLSIHKDNAYDVFNEFVEMFWYEYDAIAKEPPAHSAESQDALIEQNQKRCFSSVLHHKTCKILFKMDIN